MAKQSKSATSESVETLKEDTSVVSTEGTVETEGTEGTEGIAEGAILDAATIIPEEGQEGQEGASVETNDSQEGEGTVEGNQPVPEGTVEDEQSAQANATILDENEPHASMAEGNYPLTDDALQSHAEGVSEVVSETTEETEDEEESVNEYPYQVELKVPTVIYRGAHTSLGEKRFCGVVTVLAPADANGFTLIEFMRPGVGLTRGYVIL